MTDNEATWAALSETQRERLSLLTMVTDSPWRPVDATLIEQGLVDHFKADRVRIGAKGYTAWESRESSQAIDTPADDDALGKAQARIAALESGIRAALDKLQSVGDGLPGTSDEYSDLLDTLDILRAALRANDAIGGG